MKAVYFEQHGGIEVLKYAETPTPTPGPGEVLVRLQCMGSLLRDCVPWRLELGVPQLLLMMR